MEQLKCPSCGHMVLTIQCNVCHREVINEDMGQCGKCRHWVCKACLPEHTEWSHPDREPKTFEEATAKARATGRPIVFIQPEQRDPWWRRIFQ